MAVVPCDYSFEGIVSSGNHIGRGMGIPTINIPVTDQLDDELHFGVYVATVDLLDDEHNIIANVKGIANIGIKPTIEAYDANGNAIDNPVGIEVNLFDFNENVYNTYVRVRFHGFVRAEVKFEDINRLREQIQRDILEVQEYFEHNRLG